MRVAVMMGGPSPEHDISIESGKAVVAALRDEGMSPVSCLLTHEGLIVIADEPDFEGLPGLPPLEALLDLREQEIEAVFIALHGHGGEDGTIQAFLDWAGFPYTGCGPEASAIAMNKFVYKAMLVERGLPTPPHLGITRKDVSNQPESLIARANSLGLLPGFLKVASAGSSYGVSFVEDEEALREALVEAAAADAFMILEGRVEGREFTVAVCGDAEGEMSTLPVVEIVPKKNDYFDLASKYDEDGADEICPAKIDENLAQRMSELAISAHRLIGARGVTRTDFILGGQQPVILETNTIPGLTEASILPKAIAAAGKKPGVFYRQLLEDAKQRSLLGRRR